MNGITGDLQGFILRLGFLEYGHRPAPKVEPRPATVDDLI